MALHTASDPWALDGSWTFYVASVDPDGSMYGEWALGDSVVDQYSTPYATIYELAHGYFCAFPGDGSAPH